MDGGGLVTQIDVEQFICGMARDATTLATQATPEQLAPELSTLEQLQDEVARMIEKARLGIGRMAV